MKKSAANSKKSNDVKFYALCKYKNGESVSAIAREIGVCKSTVHYWIKTIQVPEGAKAEDYVPSIASQESGVFTILVYMQKYEQQTAALFKNSVLE